MRPSTTNRALRAALFATLFFGAAACVDKAFSPQGVSARINIQASIAAQASPTPRTVRVIVDYPTDTAIASGNGVGLVDTSATVNGSTASLSVPIDIGHCISAEQAFGQSFEAGTCELIVFVGLFDVDEQILSDTVFLLNVSPGVVPPPVSVTLKAAYTLTVANIGTGTGTVTANPPGFSYAPGTAVTLTPTASPGSTFAGWSGDCTGTGACVVTMNTNKTVLATFTLGAKLTLSTAGNGSGTITASPSAASYALGTLVTVTQTPNAGSLFTGWSGDCTGTGACVVTMTGDKTVTANYTLLSTFSGTFSGNIGNFATPSGACVSNASLSGNQVLSLIENANGTVTGTATGTAIVNAVTISGVNCTTTGGSFPFAVAVTGNDASMTWGTTGPPFNFTFVGTRSGNTITGSLSSTSIFQVSDSTGAAADTLFATIQNVTLSRTSAAAALLIPRVNASSAETPKAGGSSMSLRHR